jgi:2,3-bisphosphoglycerate-independent phosphoglycerate mutase
MMDDVLPVAPPQAGPLPTPPLDPTVAPMPIVTPVETTPATIPPAAPTTPVPTLPTEPQGLVPRISGLPFDSTYPRKPYAGPKPTVLLVLDGWGIGPNNAGNAIALANTPNMDRFWMTFPHTQLTASGEAVGLPHGEDGNTETGHLNIGAGSIVYQDLPRINMAIADGTFNTTPAFINAFNHVRQHGSSLHIMGLLGAGGVHSNIEHLFALLNLCKQQQITKVYVHAFTDGRDSPPTAGTSYISQLNEKMSTLGVGQLASIMGRYYAMDRDKRWERIEKAYNALTVGSPNCTLDPIAAMQTQYDQNITDEFIEPITICNADGSKRIIQDNDAVIFFNYRIDRPRELTRAFVMSDFEQGVTAESFDPFAVKYEKSHLKPQVGGATFQREKIMKNLYFVTMTRYEEGLPVDVAFPPQFVKNPICKTFAQHGLHQLRMSEGEKEKFVTYYMNGQQDEMYPGEDRVIIPSKGAKSYDQVPEMSAREITQEMVQRIRSKEYDVIIANFANADMVAHTGNLQATIQACQVLDEMIGIIVKEVFYAGGVVLITADHGNAEELINSTTGEIDTEHSIYPVPFIIIGQQYLNRNQMLPTGILADVAPTMLSIMGLPKPETMTGRALV